MSFQLSAAQITDYNKDGYLVVKNFLDANEINKLQQIAFDDGAMRKHAFDLNDQAGKKTKPPNLILTGSLCASNGPSGLSPTNNPSA